MKKKIITFCSIIIVALAPSAYIIKYSTGISGRTGGAGQTSCNSCHTSGTGVTSISITSTPSFANNTYLPGQTYVINVNVSSTTLSHFGFDCEILNGTTSGAANAGVITGISASSTKTLANGTKRDVVHTGTSAGTGNPSNKTFSFNWVAPTSGNVYIYAAGLAVNNNGNDGSGDLYNKTSLALTPDLSSGEKIVNQTIASLNVFPNPSNEYINLKYILSKDAKVKISLFDLQGKELEVFINENQNIGEYHKQFTYSESTPQGVYFLKTQLDEKLVSQKMIIKNKQD